MNYIKETAVFYWNHTKVLPGQIGTIIVCFSILAAIFSVPCLIIAALFKYVFLT